jgi:hypothetical protein
MHILKNRLKKCLRSRYWCGGGGGGGDDDNEE